MMYTCTNAGRSVEERFEAGEEKFGDISAHPHEHKKLKRELWEMEEHWGSLTDLMDEAEKEEKGECILREWQ